MDIFNEILRVLNELLRAIGRIEGELVEMRTLPARVSRLENWQSWLKGAWAMLTAAFAYLVRGLCAK